MLIPPRYHLTPKISQLLSSIEASREVINSIQIPWELEVNLRRKSILKSSLFSARIEGNPLSLEKLPKVSAKDLKKLEIFNIVKALNWLHRKSSKRLNLNTILYLHKLVLSGLASTENLGKFRTESGAVFNSAGVAIYLAPPPNQIPRLLEQLLKYIGSPKERFGPIKASLSHYVFEKVHPFLDGNGRVGRLLLQSILEKESYGMKGLVSLEEDLDKNRTRYYEALEVSEKNVTLYLELMLETLASAAEIAKKEVLEKRELDIKDTLLPRREEILNIIQDHRLVNFDFLRRRFLAVNERTLRYDIKKLIDLKLIKKRGSTKGVYYQAIDLTTEVST